jgi:type I restriction enzyme, S subunit
MNKQKEPKLRFPGFTGEWQEKRLGDVAEIAEFLSDIDTKIEKLTLKKELTEQYKKGAMQKIFSQKIRFKDGKKKGKITLTGRLGRKEAGIKEMNLKVYPVNTLLVSCSANLGFCAITKRELVTNQTFIGLVADDEKANIEYLYYTMISFKPEIKCFIKWDNNYISFSE